MKPGQETLRATCCTPLRQRKREMMAGTHCDSLFRPAGERNTAGGRFSDICRRGSVFVGFPGIAQTTQPIFEKLGEGARKKPFLVGDPLFWMTFCLVSDYPAILLFAFACVYFSMPTKPIPMTLGRLKTGSLKIRMAESAAARKPIESKYLPHFL